jgi:hypothetical protein
LVSDLALVPCSAYSLNLENGGEVFLQNIPCLSTDYTALHSRVQESQMLHGRNKKYYTDVDLMSISLLILALDGCE